ncbi:MAG: S1C family serine protease, partial [Limisphaerales bacterium]
VRFTFPDGRKALGRTLGVDEDSDTGLMRITDRGPWTCAEIGDMDGTRVGDWVLACGHPGGFDPKRSLVVRLGRLIAISSDAMQSDCTIAPGDSGGPLFDMHGRVIGIHSAISSSVSENFHVPITEFFLNWEQLALGGRSSTSAARGLPAYLGATAVPDTAGCHIDSVEHNGPAARAGLKAGDVVLRVDGHDIKAAATFERWLDEARAGETLSLEIQRGAQVLSFRVKLWAEKN